MLETLQSVELNSPSRSRPPRPSASRSRLPNCWQAELAPRSTPAVRLNVLLIVQKADDGTDEAFEIDGLDEVDELRALDGDTAEILAADDVARRAEAMENGSTAGVLVWERRGRCRSPRRRAPPLANW